MKLDLFTAIGVAIGGVIIAFFVTNLLLPTIEPFEFMSIDKTANSTAAQNGYDYASLSQPNNEVFNYDALNPTVEVYVGECEEYDANGNCVDSDDKNNDYDNAEDENNENNENGEEDSDSGSNEQENE